MEISRNFVSPKKWEPCPYTPSFTQMLKFICRDTKGLTHQICIGNCVQEKHTFMC